MRWGLAYIENRFAAFGSDHPAHSSFKKPFFLAQKKRNARLLEACAPKETPGHWRGKGASKANYDQCKDNEAFENNNFSSWGKKGGRKNDEEDEDNQRRNGPGDNGSGNGGRGNDPGEAQKQGPMGQTNPRDFYGYLFKPDKTPNRVLEAMLRGIAKYIVENIEPLDDKFLTPKKLAAFYKLVGGNYDGLFVDIPHASISWIYASIGCQHTLQPSHKDFEPPSIPALTERGFVRWQGIEILLGPEEHVPFIQTCVEYLNIKDPETGESFPKGLPTEAFPESPDIEIQKWHSACAEKLRARPRATAKETGASSSKSDPDT